MAKIDELHHMSYTKGSFSLVTYACMKVVF